LSDTLSDVRTLAREKDIGYEIFMDGGDNDWADRARRFLKAELKRAGVTYDDLAERLAGQGMPGETKASIANKLARGTFSASFMLASLRAIGCQTVRIEDL
jgi:hypothetical protein